MIVSTAHRHLVEGTPRAAFLAELVAARPTIVVTGAHGKTTTAAMIAFGLKEAGADPAWIIGGVVPQLGGTQARAPAGWSSRATSPIAPCSSSVPGSRC